MGFTINKMIKFLKKYKTQLGLTLLEALMSTAIVGIGFIAVFNMVNFSVQSIDTSGERTKANYLVSMIAEDIIGHKDTIHGYSTDDEAITFNDEGKPVKLNEDGEVIEEYKKFAEHLKDTEWNVGTGENICPKKIKNQRADDINYLYEEQQADAPRNKQNKWDEIFGSNRYLKCKSSKDIKNVKVFQICKWDHCDYRNENVYDDGLFIGRVQINMNDGRKRRFLYFTADYQLKK
jgi:competence protein ComGC